MTLQKLKEAIADAKKQYKDLLITKDELAFLIGLAQDCYHRSNKYEEGECIRK